MAKDLYMTKTEALLREGRATLAGLRARAASAGARAVAERKLRELEARYADAARCFEELQGNGVKGIADLKVRLEKSWEAFRAGAARPDTLEER